MYVRLLYYAIVNHILYRFYCLFALASITILRIFLFDGDDEYVADNGAIDDDDANDDDVSSDDAV